MRILGIESSCDETAAAVVEDGRRVLSNVIASQTAVHRLYQGVVPEIASRCHIEYMLPVIEQALRDAGSDSRGTGIDAIAVTQGPGLIGSLLVGVETAKALAWAWDKPLVPVHHILGHLYSIFCELPEGQSRLFELPPVEDAPAVTDAWVSPEGRDRSEPAGPGPRFDYPYVGLVVSGGHSSLIRVDAPGRVKRLGETLDDAPGEAYDKVAKCLGLDYPGGPEIDRRAAGGNPNAFDLPRPILRTNGFDFSFSGLKSAVIRTIHDFGGLAEIYQHGTALLDLCASFQAATIDVLLDKAGRAMQSEGLTRLAIVGGVACNRGLREASRRRLRNAHVVFPPPILCTDNAAMIAGCAAHLAPLAPAEARRLDARAGLVLPGAEVIGA
jgi:N6-L-threonylcarbamoyladenine synthase